MEIIIISKLVSNRISCLHITQSLYKVGGPLSQHFDRRDVCRGRTTKVTVLSEMWSRRGKKTNDIHRNRPLESRGTGHSVIRQSRLDEYPSV